MSWAGLGESFVRQALHILFQCSANVHWYALQALLLPSMSRRPCAPVPPLAAWL